MSEELRFILGIVVFVYGLLIGSFLNVLIYRIPRGENIALSRSKCTYCNHPLAAWDLFPLFSYLFLGGKCRYCKKAISARYPFVEGLNAFFYVLIYYFLAIDLLSIALMLLSSAAIVLSFIIYDKGMKNEN